MGALVSLKQQHDGAVGGSSPVVEYSYSTEDVDDGNYQRLNVMEYPSWLERLSVYGTSGSSSDTISRQTAVERQNFFISSHSQLANYQHIGLGMITEVDYVRPDIQLDFKAAHNGERNDGDYPGYDRFGRVVKQHWVDGNFDEHASDTSVPNVPPLVEIDYSYDKVGNRTKLIDGRPGASWNNRDRIATMDGLHRLTEFEHGVDPPSGTFAPAIGSQKWDYDLLGNWSVFNNDVNGDGDYLDTDEIENRDHNLANEITGRDPDDDSTNEITYTYDDAGNIRTSDDGTITTTYTHDGWNRMTKVEIDSGSGNVTRLENSYNGLNWRISKRGDTDFDGSLDQERIMYYNASWQMIEEVIYDDWSSSSPGSVDENRTYIWGERYIDDLIAIQKDTDVDGNYDDAGGSEMYYCVQDAQFSTVALVDLAGSINERITYDAYGEARHHDWRDTDGDGDYDSTDYSTLATLAFTLGTSIGQSNYRVEADLDRDGDNDSTDATLGGTTYPTPLAEGELSLPGINNPIGYDGYIFNPETEDYTVRHRWYKPPAGRWLQRDPIGNIDGMSRLSYVESLPLSSTDPMGLWRFVPNMVEFNASLAEASSTSSRFDIDAYFTKALRNSCCTEVRFLQVYFAHIDGIHYFEGFELGNWTLDIKGAPSPPFYDDTSANPQRSLFHATNDTPGRRGGIGSRSHFMAFETCLVCTVENDEVSSGDVYGCVNWGHSFNYRPGPFGKNTPVEWWRNLHDRAWSSEGRVIDKTINKEISKNGMPKGVYKTGRFSPKGPNIQFMKDTLEGLFPSAENVGN